MHLYDRWTNFTTKLCKQSSLHLYSLCMGVSFLTLVKLCKFAISNRLGGEICTSDVNIHKDYKMCQVFYTFFFNQFLLHVNEMLWSGQLHVFCSYSLLLKSTLCSFQVWPSSIWLLKRSCHFSLITFYFCFSFVNGITVEPWVDEPLFN